MHGHIKLFGIKLGCKYVIRYVRADCPDLEDRFKGCCRPDTTTSHQFVAGMPSHFSIVAMNEVAS